MTKHSQFMTLATLALLFACTPDNNINNDGSKNNEDELTVTGEASDITDYSATITFYVNLPFEIADAKVGIMYDKVQSFESAKQYSEYGQYGQGNKFTVTVTDLEPSTTYYYKSFIQNGMARKYGAVKSFITKESIIPEGAVDLGIVMYREDGTFYKLYWAKSNLNDNGLCANPEDYGDFYAWGETEPKNDYSWSTYKFGTSSSGPFSKYNTQSSYGPIDNKTVLDSEDDVASVKLGGKWRIPTEDEWYKLMGKCTWTSTTDYNGTGVSGDIGTAPNGSSIFLPAAGYKDGKAPNFLPIGMYWSSSLDKGIPCNAAFFGTGSSGYWARQLGFSVRPVTE